MENYTLDIQAFQNFLKSEKINQTPIECTQEVVKKFIYETAKVLSSHTQARRIAGLRSFFDYLIFEKYRASVGIECRASARRKEWTLDLRKAQTHFVKGKHEGAMV